MLKKIGLGIVGLFVFLLLLGAIAGRGDGGTAVPQVTATNVAATNVAVTPTETPPPAPERVSCPDGFSPTGSKGCFTVDTIGKLNRGSHGICSVRGRIVPLKDCDTMMVSLSGLDTEGRVICDGHGMISDVTAGQAEPWDGNLIGCSDVPASINLKISACM